MNRMQRSTLNFSPELLETARQLAGTKTKTETIELALNELIRRLRRKHLASMLDKLDVRVDIPRSRRRP